MVILSKRKIAVSMSITYFFKELKLKNYLLKGGLLLSVYFSILSFCYSQQYTLKDQAEIKYQAQLTLIDFNNILNLISNSAVSDLVLKDAIYNSFLSTLSSATRSIGLYGAVSFLCLPLKCTVCFILTYKQS